MAQPQSEQPVVLEHGGNNLQAQFSPDGTFLVVAPVGESVGRNPMAILWNTDTWTERARLQNGYTDAVFSLHPDSRLITFANGIWGAGTGALVRLIENATNLIFSPDGTLLLGFACDDEPEGDADEDEDEEPVEPVYDLFRLDSTSGDVLHRLTKDRDEREVFTLRFTQDGTRVTALSYTYDYIDRVYFWDVQSGAQLPTFNRVSGETSDFEVWLNVSPSGSYVINRHEQVQIWKWQETPRPDWWHQYTVRGHRHGVWDARFSADEKLLVTLGWESLPHKGDALLSHSVRLWDVASGQMRFICPLVGKCFCFALSPDNTLLATMSAEVDSQFKDAADEYILTLWDGASGRVLTRHKTSAKKTNLFFHYPTQLVFSPDGRWLAVSHVKHVEVWDVKNALKTK